MNLNDDEPITELISALKLGDEDSARRLWELYRKRVGGIAKRYLPSSANADDVSDVVQSVFRSVLNGARAGKFEADGAKKGLQHRGNLQAILFKVALHKAIRKAKKARRLITSSEVEDLVESWEDHEIEADIADVVENLRYRLDNSDPDALRVLDLRLTTAKTQKQVAQECDFSVAKVERKLRLIREHLLEALY